MVVLPLATQSSSDVTDFSEVDSTPLGVFVCDILARFAVVFGITGNST